MANIGGYNAPQGIGLQPTETGIDAHLQAARRIGTFFNQKADAIGQEGQEVASTTRDVGQVAVDYMDHREISAGAANGAQFIASMNDKWNQTVKTADPNDTTVKQKFLEQNLEPALAQFKQGFNTEKSQDWAEHFVDQYRQHMFEKTSADMSTLAGEAVKVNVAKTINGLSSAAAADPSSLDFALKSVDHSIGAMVDTSPNIDAVKGAAIKSEVALDAKEKIVKAAITGMISQNPNVDLDAVQKKYGDYINGADMKTFQRAAQSQAKANALVDKQTQVAQRQLDELNVHKAATQTLTDNVTFDPTGKPIIDPKFFSQALDIAKKNPNAPNAASTVQTMFNWGEGQQQKGAKPADDPATMTDITDRMFSVDNPTTVLDLMKARGLGKISDHTFMVKKELVDELTQTPLKDPVWQDTVAAVKANLILNSEGVPGKDIVGQSNYAKWAQTFIPQYLSMKRAGTLPPNALDVKDPNSMISQTMAPFHRDIAQRSADYTKMLLGSDGENKPPARNDAMPAIPPADQRPPGLYETPRGKMKWTGTGWVQP